MLPLNTIGVPNEVAHDQLLNFYCNLNKQLKQSVCVSLDSPGGFLEVEAHEGGKVVSPTHRPPLPPWRIPGTHFC
jgi:hypothetical protein